MKKTTKNYIVPDYSIDELIKEHQEFINWWNKELNELLSQFECHILSLPECPEMSNLNHKKSQRIKDIKYIKEIEDIKDFEKTNKI